MLVAKQLFPKPVQDTSHVYSETGVDYKGSWVAEVSVAHPSGSAIRLYQRAKRITMKLMRARASVKRFMGLAADENAKDTARKTASSNVAKAQMQVEKLENEIQVGEWMGEILNLS